MIDNNSLPNKKVSRQAFSMGEFEERFLPGGRATVRKVQAPWLYLPKALCLCSFCNLHALSWVEQPRDSFQVSTHFKGMFILLLSSHPLPAAMIKPHLFNQSVNPLRLRSLTTEKCYALYEHASSTPLLQTHNHSFATHTDYVVKP
jgi:hypothetical protein